MLEMQNQLGQWPQVEATFWYNEWNKATGDAHEDNWGLLKRDFTRKPAYFAMKCVASGICGGQATSEPTPTATTTPRLAPDYRTRRRPIPTRATSLPPGLPAWPLAAIA